MDKDMDERSSMTGSSAKLGESLELGGIGVAQLEAETDGEIGIDDDNGWKLTVEELSDAKKAAVEVQREEVTKFQDNETTASSLTPVSVFPEEVWEQILSELDDSKDVLNAFKAYPYLEGRVLKNKYWWLFDQVVPHLRPWLNDKELLSCRLICKKWSHGVDNHLENLPCRNVVEHGLPITGQVWHPKGSRAYDDYKLRARDNTGCEVSFLHAWQLTQFLQDMDKKHPATRNPFPGRSVTFMVPWPRVEQVEYLNAFMEILRKHGCHIWFLKLMYSGEKFCQLVLDITYFLPNLKALQLSGTIHLNVESYVDTFQLDDKKLVFPHMSKLESLDIRFLDYADGAIVPGNFMQLFLTCISTQIKRLCITSSELRRQNGILFPNLRELKLLQVEHPKDIVDQLTSLNAPDLSSLSIEVEFREPPGEPISYVKLNDILSWVKPFTKLQHFGVDLNLMGEETEGYVVVVEPPVFECIPSIKSLTISWPDVLQLGPEFLRFFPSLRYATVWERCPYYAQETYELQKWIVSKKRNVYRWDLWEELSSLREINIRLVSYPRLPSHFNRATYEWQQKQREARQRPLTDEELQDCIEGFKSMVSVSWGNEQDASAEGRDSQLEFDDM